jgi:hypothetical protein
MSRIFIVEYCVLNFCIRIYVRHVLLTGPVAGSPVDSRYSVQCTSTIVILPLSAGVDAFFVVRFKNVA